MDIAELLRKRRRVRTIGVDDGPFRRDSSDPVLLVGAVCSGTRFEGLVSGRVQRDGFDATDRLGDVVTHSKFADQLHAILINGVTVAGFNVIDLAELRERVGRPVISVMRRRPDRAAMERAIARLDEPERRLAMLRRAGPIESTPHVFFQAHGLDPEVAARLLEAVTQRGHIPEPLRIAHLIAGGLVTGESGRRA